MPSPYQNTGVDQQRDAITAALMDINQPQPQTPMPQMPQLNAMPGLPQTPMPGAPPQGAPIGGAMPPQQAPLAGATPPMQGGLLQQPGGAAMQPGANAMPQMPMQQTGTMPQR